MTPEDENFKANGGFFLIHRSIAQHPMFDGRAEWLGVWVRLIQLAQWEQKRIRNKGQMIPLQRGQLVAGRAWLAKQCGVTERKIRTILKAFESDNMIEIDQSSGHYSNVITICNYDKYQMEKPSNDQRNDQSATSERPESDQIQKKEKKINKINNSSSTRGSRLPHDWMPSLEDMQWAQVNFYPDNAAIMKEAEAFRDYWIAQPGQKGVKVDWQATFRSWLRKAHQPATVTQRRPDAQPHWMDEKRQRDRLALAIVNGGAA